MRKPAHWLVPFLLSIGPLWILLFSGSDVIWLKLAGFVGALGLSVGLMLMLAKIYALQHKIDQIQEKEETGTPRED